MPDGQAATVAAAAEGADDRAWLDRGTAVLRELATRLADASERIRSRMDRLGELDLASQDVLIEVVRALEQQLWMLRVQLSP